MSGAILAISREFGYEAIHCLEVREDIEEKLLNFYNSDDLVRDLIGRGDIECLEETVGMSPHVIASYARSVEKYGKLIEFCREKGCVKLYVFKDSWKYTIDHGGLPLHIRLKELPRSTTVADDPSPEKNRRIVWDDEQKESILREARRIKSVAPKTSFLQLMIQSQETLDKEFWRPWLQLPRISANTWFFEGLEEANQELEPQSAPTEPEIPVELLTIAQSFIDTMREDREKMASSLEIVNKIAENLNRKIDEFTNKVERMLIGGFAIYPIGVVPQEVVAKPTISVPQTNSEPIKTRKPRIVVLDLQSGHERYGIEKGTDGYVASVNFIDTFGTKVPDFSSYDYVICTKYTSISWLPVAKASIFKDKLIVVQGSVRDRIVPAIKALPPIEEKA